MKILHLTLKRQWFDMIASGEKLEEYRVIKPYWIKRLLDEHGLTIRYDVVRFRNGYSKTSPTMDVEWKGLRIGEGNEKWGAVPGETYFATRLGEILKPATS